jgi:hypothetical protein
MLELKFDTVHGSWKGNDYASVSITSVTFGSGTPGALVFMTHMNVDFDGAPNAYGPPEKSPLDSLADAGRYGATGYYGLMAVDPKEVEPHDPLKRLIKDVHHLKLDLRYPDTKGKCPVVQKSPPYAGFFVSTTSKRNVSGSSSPYEQSHSLDSSAVAYCALSYNLQQKGVGDGDFGIAIRHDTFRQASFSFLGGEGHGRGSAGAGAVGECSYKVFLDIGGSPKTSGQKYANNNFPTSFIVFPGSRASQLVRISLAENAEDFAVFLALQAQVDAAARGHSGLPAFRKYVAGGRKTKPASYGSVAAALQSWGYAPGLSEVVAAASGLASSIAAAAGKLIP